MSKQNIFLSVIVPVYNEATRLPPTLRRLQEYLSKSPFSSEILVVLDGPTDRTQDILRRISNEIDGLKTIERGENRGKG